DPLLYGWRGGRGLRPSADQGPDRATDRTWAAHHAFRVGPSIPTLARGDGTRLDSSLDRAARHRLAFAATRLGRRLSLRTAHRRGGGHLRAVRDQCKFRLPDPRPGAR